MKYHQKDIVEIDFPIPGEGYEQTTFHKLTGWGNWLRTNQHYLWGNPTSNGGGPLK